MDRLVDRPKTRYVRSDDLAIAYQCIGRAITNLLFIAGPFSNIGTLWEFLAVHLAARIVSLADAGEILASRTVRDLVIGSELTFSDRGEHELKRIPDRWALYAVT